MSHLNLSGAWFILVDLDPKKYALPVQYGPFTKEMRDKLFERLVKDFPDAQIYAEWELI